MNSKIRLIIVVLLIIAIVPFGRIEKVRINWPNSENIRVMTLNVRTSRLSILDWPNLWILRRYVVAKIVQREKPEIIALQEATLLQTEWFEKTFTGYVLLKEYPTDPKKEYPTLLIREDRFQIKGRSRRWFSEAPQIPDSISWGNRKPRSFMSAELVDTFMNRKLAVASVHLDYQSQDSRSESIWELAQWVREQKYPVILMGDFNETPDKSEMSLLIQNTPIPEFYPLSLIDAFRAIKQGEQGTLNGYNPVAKARIDLILVSRMFKVRNCRVVRSRFAGIYPSDHYPVVAELAWPHEPLKYAMRK